MKEASSLLNFSSCVVIAVATTLCLLNLYDKRKGDTRFVYRAFTCWVLSWWAWVLLWGLSRQLPNNTPSSALVLLSFSDCNTILLILFYLGMTRGRNYEPGRYFLHGLLVVAFNIAVLVSLYGLVGVTEQGVALHERWSLALGIFSPVLVGWAFKLRYQTDYVLFAGLTYAASQPLAYAALFGKVFDPDVAQSVLASLAILKIGWATAVTYYAGIKPLSTENLIRLPRHSLDGRPSASWLLLVIATIVGGAIVLGVEMWVEGVAMLGSLAVIMAGIVFFVAFLGALGKLASVAQRWLRDSPPDDDQI